jgi:hypothetical protein
MSAAQKKYLSENPEALKRIKDISKMGVEAQRPYKSEQMSSIYLSRDICPSTGRFLKSNG